MKVTFPIYRQDNRNEEGPVAVVAVNSRFLGDCVPFRDNEGPDQTPARDDVVVDERADDAD